MLKLREELLLVEEKRKAGEKVYTIDKFNDILNTIIDNVKKERGDHYISDLPEGKIYYF